MAFVLMAITIRAVLVFFGNGVIPAVFDNVQQREQGGNREINWRQNKGEDCENKTTERARVRFQMGECPPMRVLARSERLEPQTALPLEDVPQGRA